MIKKGVFTKLLLGALICFATPLSSLEAMAKTSPVMPEDVISKSQEAQYFEKYLGYIEVGVTTRSELEEYIGEGTAIKTNSGEKVYYIDPKNKRTLIITTDYKGRIEVVNYKVGIELPPNVPNISLVKVSRKLNIKNLMTSMGSRIGYNTVMLMNAYGRPSVEVTYPEHKEIKYIMLGSYHRDMNFVYLEYSFKLSKNKVVEIRIENGK